MGNIKDGDFAFSWKATILIKVFLSLPFGLLLHFFSVRRLILFWLLREINALLLPVLTFTVLLLWESTLKPTIYVAML
ncbi:hypothetical protein RchiOBHm_Chr3g0497631 [Rosa chinensis]|uniref:Uncharacterized protein n=1 Tax=Rosa chinensis TaxID=74649 RepID=A0A2P6RHT0_ROSCH|nr:hypothetical protein RchiOBHm_Chr3g0497631 [Rosa chinensis]